SRGFTLIEIVIVLAIAAIIMGGAVGVMVYSSDERVLRNASGEIELLAKRARTIAILNQTPYALEFREGVVRLLPLAQAGMDQKKLKHNIFTNQDSKPANTSDNRQLTLDDGMEVRIRRWNSEDWLSTAKNTVHVWRFDPDGLCEPISVRLILGNSWSEDTYHPLTATIRDSQLEAR
ncbi:MAG: prepilin-type N-terminal cleavage/methylation domain-containing protein, partial [Verrucomicrobiaceae bacterium]